MLYLLIIQMATLNLLAITLGVVPQQSPFRLMKVWSPIVEYLENETGEKITLKIERSIEKFEKTLYSGGYDVAYMNPYHYVVAHNKQGYLAQVRAKKNLVGILVANKNSDLSSPFNFKNKTFLFPAPNAFAATLLTKYELLKNFNVNVDKDEKFLYVNSHDSVYKGVARGIGEVGGGIERTLNNLQDKQTKDSLLVVYKTQAYPSHPFAFHPSMKDEVKNKFTQSLLRMPTNLLQALSMKEMIKTDNAEYEIIRDMAKELLMQED